MVSSSTRRMRIPNHPNAGSTTHVYPNVAARDVWLPHSFVYDVDDEMGASRGREKHPCFYDASGGF